MISTPVFQINEKIKENMVSFYGAEKARSIYREKGIFLIDEPFLETEIFFKSSKIFKKSSDVFYEMTDMLFEASIEIKKLGGLMTEPYFELVNGLPVMVWGLFGPRSS